ncbi:tRNA lysidine(34) synthetase TilS [Marinobacter sp. X15-166B]|uniref:tRNA lysidine(34) synthetase TilS n=1 Tax=Marinobacter sp. X15-166B TaxID=1897620 RepID=UPI001D174DCE|nr:tRNA lysidine(34) synthetase TilS [Marinobacter sp. X15-166B]
MAEQKNLLRWWVEQCGGYPAPTPTNWPAMLRDLLLAGPDRAPVFSAEGFDIRRYRGELYLVPHAERLPGGPLWLEPGKPVDWLGQRVQLEPAATAHTHMPKIRVVARQGGERIREWPQGHSRPLKKWLQDKAVPPWERARIPLLYEADELVGVGQFWLSPKYSGPAPESGWRIIWGGI